MTIEIYCFVLLVSASTFLFAGKVLPQHESCTVGQDNANSCDVVLDSGGLLIEGVSGHKLSVVSENTGMMSANSLYKYSDRYILEHLDFSSSQARQWIIFDYIDRKIVIDRVYSFSQALSSKSVLLWYGYECRGSGEAAVHNNDVAFSDAVVAAFCGEATQDNLRVKRGAADSADGDALNLDIPVYRNKKIVGEASYFFFDSDKPDLFQMACYLNCALSSRHPATTYIGRVSKSAWFVSQLIEQGCNSRGAYSYRTSQQKIVLSGCIGAGKVNLIEFSSGKASERAEFSGSSDGEGYRGEWVSKSGDNKRFAFFMYPSTVF